MTKLRLQGNTGRPPTTKTNAEVKRRVLEHMDLLSRSAPDAKKRQVFRFCTSEVNSRRELYNSYCKKHRERTGDPACAAPLAPSTFYGILDGRLKDASGCSGLKARLLKQCKVPPAPATAAFTNATFCQL